MFGDVQCMERCREGGKLEGAIFHPKLIVGNRTCSFCKDMVNLRQCHYGKHQLLHEAWPQEEEVGQSLHWSHRQQSYPEFQSQGGTAFHHIHQLHHHYSSFAVSHDQSNERQENPLVDTLAQANTMPSSYCACLEFCTDQFLLLHSQKKEKEYFLKLTVTLLCSLTTKILDIFMEEDLTWCRCTCDILLSKDWQEKHLKIQKA